MTIFVYVNKEIDNSYLEFQEEPTNNADPDAIKVMVRGEYYGMAGYVGREYTSWIRDILSYATSYRLDVENKRDIGNNTINLVLSWTQD